MEQKLYEQAVARVIKATKYVKNMGIHEWATALAVVFDKNKEEILKDLIQAFELGMLNRGRSKPL